MKRQLAWCVSAILSIGASSAFAIQPTIGDIVDTRSSGGNLSNLQIEIKVVGDEVPDIEGLRATVISAIDETGRDIADLNTKSSRSQKFTSSKFGGTAVRLQLKNPSRRASVVKELIGRLDLFIPRNDPESTIVIDDVWTKTGKPLEASALKNAGVAITVLTKAQYEEDKKAGEAKSPLGGLMGWTGIDAGGDSALILALDDPDGRFVSLLFETPDGAQMTPGGTMTVGKYRFYNFRTPLPNMGKLKLKVATLKSTVRVPFNFENIQLP